MAEAARRIKPVTLDEFDAMDFGDRRAELIAGAVVVAQAFPTPRHGQITAQAGAALVRAVDDADARCRVETGTGIDVRLERDFRIGPDVLVRCGDRPPPGEPVLVLEVLSPSNSASEMLHKLRAYQAVATITDILFLEQDRIYAEHWSRPAAGTWGAAEHLMGPQAVARLPWPGATLPLAAVYRRVLEDDAAAS